MPKYQCMRKMNISHLAHSNVCEWSCLDHWLLVYRLWFPDSWTSTLYTHLIRRLSDRKPRHMAQNVVWSRVLWKNKSNSGPHVENSPTALSLIYKRRNAFFALSTHVLALLTSVHTVLQTPAMWLDYERCMNFTQSVILFHRQHRSYCDDGLHR